MPDLRYLQTILDAARRSSRSEREISRAATGSHAAISQIKTGRVPSVERIRRLCDALGLEFYIGPPRKGRLKELEERVLTPEERARIPPELRQAMEEVVEKDDTEFRREALAGLDRTLRWAIEKAEAISADLRPPNVVPADLARFLGLKDNCTLQEALAAIEAQRRQLGEAEPVGSDEYVPVDSFIYKEASIKRRALPPWAGADSLFLIVASRHILDAIEPTVPEGNHVVVDLSQAQPLHDALFLIARKEEFGPLTLERVLRSGGEWVLLSGRPGRKPRLGKGSMLYGRVAWHGPETSPDLYTSHTEDNLVEINSLEGDKVRAAIRASRDRISKPVTGGVQRKATGSDK